MTTLNRILLLLSVVILLLTPSCTEVDVCTDEQHPHFSTVSYTFNWDNFVGQQPDSLYVIAYRVINMWKTSMIVDRQTQTGIYHYNAPTAQLADYSGLSSFPIPGGEYRFMAFNQSNLELNYDIIEQFSESDDMALSDLQVSYRTYRRNDTLLTKPISEWTDYNAYSYFMQPSTNAICLDTISTTEMKPNVHRTINFQLHPITQQIDIYFDINKITKNTKFTVDSVFGEISGIPFTIDLFNGYIDIRRTCKMMFRCELQNTSGVPLEKDTDPNTNLRCHGTIAVPTIVQSDNSNVYTGPGIMQVVICCSTANPDYPILSTKERREKKFQGIINLYNTLEKAKLYKYSDDGQHVTRNAAKKELHIEKVMDVDGKMVLENSDDNGGVDIWKSTLADTILVHI